jgi:quercetin dioxygenase-like cupin family protein
MGIGEIPSSSAKVILLEEQPLLDDGSSLPCIVGQRKGSCERIGDAKMQSVKLEQAFDLVTELWSPKVVGRVNDQYVKLAKAKGELTWHKHEFEDEMFLIVKGRLVIQFEHGQEVVLGPGEFYVVPKGVLHNPVAEEECWIMLIESVTTKHTGDVVTDRTRSIEEQLAR